MPTWEITTPDGLSFELTGDQPPDETTIQRIERQIRGQPAEETPVATPETSAVGAFGRAAAENVLPSAGGWAGALAGARAGAMIPIPHPYAKIAGGFIGGLLGFLGTSWGQRKIAEKVAPEATKEFEEMRGADVEKHPVAGFAGSVAGAVPFFQFNPMATAREIGTLATGRVAITRSIPSTTGVSTITSRTLSPAAKEAAVSLGAKLGLGAGFGAAPAVIEGRAPTLREVGEGAGFAAILGAPRWVGAPSAHVVTPEVLPPETATTIPEPFRIPDRRRFVGTPEGTVIDVEARPVRGLLPGPRGRFVVTPEGRTVDIESLSPEELAAFQRTAAFRGRPQEVPPVPSEAVPPRPPTEEPPPEGLPGVPVEPVPPKGPPGAPAAEVPTVTPTVEPTAKPAVSEPILFPDNPQLAHPVSWWRKFSTVQGAAKMGAKTRANLVKYTKVENTPKAIADFISKRIGEVEGKATVSETVAPTPEPTVSPVAEPKAAVPEAKTTEATAKVESEIKSVAATEGKRPAAEIKEELIFELQKKLMKAPAEAKPGDTVTVEIPGDGTFTVVNSIDALTEIISRAKQIKTGPGTPPGVPKKAIKQSAKAISKTASRPTFPPPKGPGGNVGMGAATPEEFQPPPETEPFRAFQGWSGRAKEILQKVKEYLTPPQAGDLPEVDIQPDAILPRLPKPSIENKIASSPQGIGRVPGLGAIADPRATAHAPSDAPFLGRANSISKGKTFAAIWGQTQWANKDLFKVNPDTGTFPLTNGKQGHLSDVIEAEMRDPGSQPITINQYRWIHDEWIPLQRDVNKMLREEGVREVHTDDMEFEVGKDYFPRPAIGKRNRPVSGPGGKPGGKPGAKQFFQKGRKFATEEEGARPAREGESKEVIIYDPDPISRVVKFISGAYRSVADHRLAIAPELGAGTVKEIWGVGRRVNAGPSFQGKVYPVDVAAKIERAYGAPVSFMGLKVGEVTAAAKAMMATGDVSAPLIQGAAMFGRHPARWARSVASSFKALFDPKYVARLIEQPRYKQLVAEYSQSGGSLFQLQDFMAGAGEGQMATRLPGVGQLLKATGRAYGAFLDIAKLEIFDAWRKVAPKNEWPRIVETTENSLFSARMEQIGLNPHRALAERLMLFAPAYYRGAIGLLSTAFQKGVSGNMARQMLMGYAGSGMLVTLGAYAALGLSEDEVTERMNPAKGTFMKVPVELADGSRVEVGIGNILTQFVRLIAQAKAYHIEDRPINTGTESNPYLRFLRGRAAILPSVGIEISTGRDYFGNRITIKESVARHFAPFAIQSLFPREEVGPQQRMADAAFTFLGLSAYPESEYRENLRRIDRLSYDTNHRPFAKSTPAQRSNVIRQFKQSDAYTKHEPDSDDMERIIALTEQRRRELIGSLSDETREKLERLGLEVAGYRATLRVNGNDVPLTEPERERYRDLLAEELERTVKRMNEKALSDRRPDVLEKIWSSQREAIGVRARRRLLVELNNGGQRALQK